MFPSLFYKNKCHHKKSQVSTKRIFTPDSPKPSLQKTLSHRCALFANIRHRHRPSASPSRRRLALLRRQFLRALSHRICPGTSDITPLLCLCAFAGESTARGGQGATRWSLFAAETGKGEAVAIAGGALGIGCLRIDRETKYICSQGASRLSRWMGLAIARRCFRNV